MAHLRFLIAEDDPVIAMDIGATLSDAGYGVSDVVEGVEALQESIALGDFDAAILASQIRNGTTFAAARRIRATGRPVGFVTGWSAKELPQSLQGLPIIGKPFVPEELVVLADEMALENQMRIDASDPQSAA